MRETLCDSCKQEPEENRKKAELPSVIRKLFLIHSTPKIYWSVTELLILDTMNVISFLQCLLGTTRPFSVMHSGWEKIKKEHKDVWVPCLNCLQRDLLLCMDCRMEERFGFFLPLQLSSITPANVAVLDISHDITPHTVPGHVFSRSFWKLQVNTLSPAKNPSPTRFI